jgi:S1-C subfamily serine protease
MNAGPRQIGARCAHCQAEVALGDRIAVCGRCGAVHHAACYEAHGNSCGAYECAPARRDLMSVETPILTISPAEVEAVRPPPPRRSIPYCAVPVEPLPPPRIKKLAVASFIVALAGIPLFGLLTGLVAIVLGSIALGSIQQSRQRGTGFALTGILLGLADMVGWCIFLAIALSRSHVAVDIGEFEPDATVLENLAPHVRNPMFANVLIQSAPSKGGLAGGAFGSGVILQIRDAQALIVTNRHVIDADYSGGDAEAAAGPPAEGQLQVKLVGQSPQPGRVLWTAPHGIDLALVGVGVISPEPKAVPWRRKQPLMAGEEIFTIGNPQHLDGSITRGVISQFRLLTRGGRKIRLIQTDAALNPGNSGGGLYDKDGVLIGINTLASDKRFAEGINFAITFESFLELHPPLHEEAEKPENSAL